MNRKIIATILTGIITVLLITGCSSKTEDKDVSGAGTTQSEKKEEKKEENPVILPADSQIGIAYAEDSSEFMSFFLNKVQGNLVSAGIPEGSIERAQGSAEELADNARTMISSGCSVLMVGNADENNAPGITDAAVKAGIPVLYFGTSPGEKEIARWKDKGWRVSYVGGEIGIAVLYTGEDKAGDQVNADTLKNLEELGVSFTELTAGEEDVYRGTDLEASMEQVVGWMST